METALVEPADPSKHAGSQAGSGEAVGTLGAETAQARRPLTGCAEGVHSPQALTALHSQDAALCLPLKTGGLGEPGGLGSACTEGRPNAGLMD